MASCISYKDQFFNVSNARFAALIEFGLQVATSSAEADAEKTYAAALKKNSDGFYPGYDLAIEREFPTKDERKFWARVYFDLAHLIFCRKIGNQNANFWQYSAVGDSYLLARMFTRSVQDEEQGWHPQTLAAVEFDIYNKKGVNLRL